MELHKIMAAATRACSAGMTVIHRHQRCENQTPTTEKGNGTLLTVADTSSQETIRATLEPFNLAFWGEEGETKDFIGENRYGAIVDPLDGTNSFVIGLLSSTVIVGIYDREEHQLAGCVIGEPVSRRIWRASSEMSTRMAHGSPRFVWTGNEKSSIFLDVCHGFKSRGRQVLTDRGNAALYASLNSQFRILIPGSNGLMQALVANGRERMAGSITTAVGFPGDVCGALLVKQAGGFLKAYERADDGRLVETNPLNPLNVDALICANTPATLARLSQAFETVATIK